MPGTTSFLTNHEVSKAWDVGGKHGIPLNLCSSIADPPGLDSSGKGNVRVRIDTRQCPIIRIVRWNWSLFYQLLLV